jgi:voltage-gated potassium channel
VLGQILTSLIMLVGYSIIAVPTGIFAAELAAGIRDARQHAACPGCQLEDHESDARYCRRCGTELTRAPHGHGA